MTAGERDVRLRRLQGVEQDERGVLTNARCLNEGVDVPTLDGVVFIDPRRSQVDVVQAVGRAIRKAENKSVGTIVIPVFLDEDADPGRRRAAKREQAGHLRREAEEKLRSAAGREAAARQEQAAAERERLAAQNQLEQADAVDPELPAQASRADPSVGRGAEPADEMV
jgi:predicted helicase